MTSKGVINMGISREGEGMIGVLKGKVRMFCAEWLPSGTKKEKYKIYVERREFIASLCQREVWRVYKYGCPTGTKKREVKRLLFYCAQDKTRTCTS